MIIDMSLISHMPHAQGTFGMVYAAISASASGKQRSALIAAGMRGATIGLFQCPSSEVGRLQSYHCRGQEGDA